ncbi:germination protein YpeB [Paludicola sp. MB14-C6]|uniref:germination protein YpeB n=1 Tax=Paludihabitans sp. MB14-C6 TaxID=3070656 RepID=UPI0027DD06D4|nr:germination protein YpeB [Paludicola sp. MB14-C6]WMJ22122.1 germination protein YpeB [Paludicola sp. MB14-C6]
MTFRITKRALIRLISFAVAIILVASLLVYTYSEQTHQSKLALQYQYMQSVDDLTHYAQNVNSDLTKIIYAQTPEYLAMLSSKLWRESGYAKDRLASLPIDNLKIQNTNKLLSQVGDYCVSLSKSYAEGNTITEEQRNNLMKLNEYCDGMLREMVTVSDEIKTGAISLSKVKSNVKEEASNKNPVGDITEGFKEFEEGFSSYPSLIYDGPFSDHIMQREPQKLKGQPNISRAEAKKIASQATLLSIEQLKDENDEDSRMPSYCFSAEGLDISVTKKGGFVCYLLKSRLVTERKINVDQAKDKARTFMDTLKIGALTTTYYEISNNIITINYAYMQNDIIVYPDLIKVSVALDNGEIIGYDARGYLMNHKERQIKAPKYSKEDASANVNKNLKIESSRLAIVPSGGLSEVLCYEFKCKTSDDKQLLVYVNANTKVEEQILILLINENGTLTI